MGAMALEGVKVVDFSWVGVGPMTTKTLADHGAVVIRVESAEHPDTLRVTMPFRDSRIGLNRSGYFAWYNTSKFGMAVDLGNPKGREVAKRLAAWADIVVESFRPGTMKNLGLAYEDLKQVKPDIIMMSMSMQGQTGPHSRSAAFGVQLVGLTGFSAITGWPDRRPAGPYGAYTDWIAPSFGVAAVLAALNYRKRTGKGLYIDLSQCETGIQFLTPLILDYTANSRVFQRNGNYSSYLCPHGAYRCRGEDRWCVLAVSDDAQWNDLCKLLGKPDWTTEDRFATLLGRKKNEDELNKLIEGWTVSQAAEEVMHRMQGAGISCGVVQSCQNLMENDPQLKHRQLFSELNHSEIGKCSGGRPSFLLSRTPAALDRAAPCLGQHTEYVCREILKMSDGEFVELLNDGVFK